MQKPEFINLSIPVDVFVPQIVASDATDEVNNELNGDYQVCNFVFFIKK